MKNRKLYFSQFIDLYNLGANGIEDFLANPEKFYSIKNVELICPGDLVRLESVVKEHTSVLHTDNNIDNYYDYTGWGYKDIKRYYYFPETPSLASSIKAQVQKNVNNFSLKVCTKFSAHINILPLRIVELIFSYLKFEDLIAVDMILMNDKLQSFIDTTEVEIIGVDYV